MARSFPAAALALACALAGCGSSKDPVQARLDQLEEAAEARDVEAFAEGLGAGFRAGPFDRAGALAELRRYFALYESVSLEVYGVEVERGQGRATVRCVVEFSGEGKKFGGLDKLLPPGAVYRFTLEMADEGGKWLVQSTVWEVVTPTAPSPASLPLHWAPPPAGGSAIRGSGTRFFTGGRLRRYAYTERRSSSLMFHALHFVLLAPGRLGGRRGVETPLRLETWSHQGGQHDQTETQPEPTHDVSPFRDPAGPSRRLPVTRQARHETIRGRPGRGRPGNPGPRMPPDPPALERSNSEGTLDGGVRIHTRMSKSNTLTPADRRELDQLRHVYSTRLSRTELLQGFAERISRHVGADGFCFCLMDPASGLPVQVVGTHEAEACQVWVEQVFRRTPLADLGWLSRQPQRVQWAEQ